MLGLPPDLIPRPRYSIDDSIDLAVNSLAPRRVRERVAELAPERVARIRRPRSLKAKEKIRRLVYLVAVPRQKDSGAGVGGCIRAGSHTCLNPFFHYNPRDFTECCNIGRDFRVDTSIECWVAKIETQLNCFGRERFINAG